MYGSNGRPLNREVDLEAILDEKSDSSQPMEIRERERERDLLVATLIG